MMAPVSALEPRRPTNVSPHSLACLEALSSSGLGRFVSIGGAFGLAHYLEYRETRDLDAWWSDDASPEDRARTVGAIESALRPFGGVRTRSWGDVASVELSTGGKVSFSFQIARRSARLEPGKASAWRDVAVDGFPDLLASKMEALVERGAPRDFRDVHAVCGAALADPATCWTLWEKRRALAAAEADRRRAALAIRTHLARIEQARPLESIIRPEERAAAAAVRKWFVEEFLRDVPG